MLHDKELWLQEITATIPAPYQSDFRTFIEARTKRNHSRSRKTFYQWVVLQAARDQDTAFYLEWLSYAKLPPEEVAPKTSDDFPYEVSADGTTALIRVGDDKTHGVWKIPVEHLNWARTQFPVWLKRLPDLEPIELKRQREIKHQLRYMSEKLTKDQMAALRKEVLDLGTQVKKAYAPVPRFQLMKTVGGRDVEVHRLYMGIADDRDVEVTTVDGDFLNFAATKIRVMMEPVASDGFVAAKRPEPLIEIVSVPNLQIVQPSAEEQEKFEKKLMSYKWTPQGDISEKPLRVLPNADLGRRTGCHGVRFGDVPVVVDCGRHEPTTPEERYSPERFGRQPPQQTLDADSIRRAWRDSRRARGF